jgi:hypothetical protein
MSLMVDVEIELTDTVVKWCTQALIDCGATGCFIDIEWAKLNNIPTCPLTKPIPVYNVDGTANNTSTITDIADMILRYEHHSERTQLAVTRLGKQCQGTPAVVLTRASIRASVLNKGGSGDPGARSIVGRAHTKTHCIRYIYYRPQQITIC